LYCRPVSRVCENTELRFGAIHSYKYTLNYFRAAVIGAGHSGIQTGVSPNRNTKVAGSTLQISSPTSHNNASTQVGTSAHCGNVVRNFCTLIYRFCYENSNNRRL
jgi:hypothetical protein